MILYTDAYAPYQAMIAVYDVLGSAEEQRGFKVKNISVPTQSEIQEYIEFSATTRSNPSARLERDIRGDGRRPDEQRTKARSGWTRS